MQQSIIHRDGRRLLLHNVCATLVAPKGLIGNMPSSKGGYHSRKLTLISLTTLIFYSVSGGPFGIEEIVKAGGPLYALMGFSLLLVWAIPAALITAELSTAIPEASGI